MNYIHHRSSPILFLILILTFSLLAYTSIEASDENKFDLKILWTENDSIYEGKVITIYAAGNQPAIDNIRNHEFDIFHSDPLTGCSTLKNQFAIQDSFRQSLIVVDGDADCSVYMKIEKVKETGVKGIILMTSARQPIPKELITNSGFLIFYTFDKYAIEALKSSPESFGSVNSANPKDYTKNNVDIWISSLEEKSYELLEDFESILKISQIKEKINWNVRFALWSCTDFFSINQRCLTDQQFVNSCACSGEFCSPQKYVKASDAVVKQDIRQKIIFDDHTEKFFDYIKLFKKKCLKKFKQNKYTEDCAEMILNELQMQTTEIQNKLEHFLRDCAGPIFGELLVDKNRFTEIGYYPAILLDRVQIEFKSQRDLKSKICRKLALENTKSCSNYVFVDNVVYVATHFLIPIIIAVGILAIIVLLIRKYKKNLSKSMDKEIKMQVEASVANYFTLSQSK